MNRHHGHHHGPHCGCPKQIVHPTKHNCVNQYSESVVEHVHPSHTTVMNHHLVKNKHYYPHSTSVQNTSNSVNEFGGAFNVPPGNQVAGAMSPGGPGMGAGPGYGYGPGAGPGNQEAGAMSPGNCGNQVAGANMPGYGNHSYNMQHNYKPKKWR
ncbi:CotD family spore coat protein [Lentibacillus sediminis]|uniref:CotD family spore coat protein n=1 Tax=Lentibacillus sediminis TaxID=1940529 RepID=UPI000C1BFDBD|nr:spore coat protein [Lentibacillus sediminis]